MGTFSEVFCAVYNKTGYSGLAMQIAEEAASRDRTEQYAVELLRDLTTKFGNMYEIFTEGEIDKVREGESSSTQVEGTEDC